MLQDVRFALRLLVKNLGFTIVAITTLGLAVAANTVVFSIVDAILIRPLPYPHPERLVRVYTQAPMRERYQFPVSAPEYVDLARDSKSYESVGAWNMDLHATNLSGGDHPVAVNAALVTASFLPTMGVAPLLGRFFDPSEDTPGDPRVVVLAYRLYESLFGADPSVVGKTVYVNAVPVTVVGVMPKAVDFPEWVDVWLPLRIDPEELARDRRYGSHRLHVVARLKAEVSIAQAEAELALLMPAWSEGRSPATEDVIDPRDHPLVLRALHPDKVASVRVALWTLQAAVMFVLLIACANISNLLLARAEARSGEIAVRTALGASRPRMVRQFLTESLVLGCLGAGTGILLAMWGIDAAMAFLPDGVPRTSEIHLDPTVLAFAVLVSMGTSLVFGLAPIIHAHGELAGTLRAAGQRTTGGRNKQLFRRALIVLEVSLACVLVLGAGLMVRSFVRLQQVELGFDPRNVVSLQLQLPDKTYDTEAKMLDFWLRLRDGAANLPGVQSATLMRELMPRHRAAYNGFRIVGRPETPGMVSNVDNWQYAGDDFFSTMGIPVVRGRVFTPSDGPNAPAVVLINQAMATKFWPGEDPVGQRIIGYRVARPGEPAVEQTIIGVVGDVKQQGLDAPATPELYFPLRQLERYGDGSRDWSLMPESMYLVIRAQNDPRALFGALRAHVASLDEGLAVARLNTMDDVLYDAVAKPRFVALLFTVFAGIALVMAAIGIFGVMSYSIEQRTRELSIRMALGADAGRLQKMLVLEGLRLAAAGVVLGLACAFVVSLGLRNWLSALLFDVGVLDPATYALVVVSTALVAALACWLPARRATRVHPMIAMRNE
ncbi:ABC transporter permease [Pendulispora albinea]|uniref:ABC transporter permease n=1 Tax=Pendulispora albinea TaxID=2741071 RepID=A0ABZ2LYZ4_9BACT